MCPGRDTAWPGHTALLSDYSAIRLRGQEKKQSVGLGDLLQPCETGCCLLMAASREGLRF